MTDPALTPLPPHSQSTPGTPRLIARASSTVRNKNLLIVLMCLGMACWFAYDGWIGWPGNNDKLVAGPIATRVHDDPMYTQYQPVLDGWHGWNAADSKARLEISNLARATNVEGWKTETDIRNQQYIVCALLAATAGAIWWFVHCQKRRVIAEGETVSPSPGVVLPWSKITVVDNTRWKTMGIVQITYDVGAGPQKAKFDDYETDREPLLLILDQLAEKAVNAEFIPKEEAEEKAADGTATGV